MDTPALDHWTAVSAKFELLVQFMAWLDANHGYYLASDTARELADRFLFIDRKQLTQECVSVLKEQLQDSLQAELQAFTQFLVTGDTTQAMAGLQSHRAWLLQQGRMLDELVQQLVPATTAAPPKPATCTTCHTWGRTVSRDSCPKAVACPACKRLTWPHIGVNCPAGASVAIASANAVEVLRTVTNAQPDGTGGEIAGFMVGDVVIPRADTYEVAGEWITFQLHCATQRYSHAIVASLEPFVLVSDSGDMTWTQVKPEYFQRLCQAHASIKERAVQRYRRDQAKEAAAKAKHDKITT